MSSFPRIGNFAGEEPWQTPSPPPSSPPAGHRDSTHPPRPTPKRRAGPVSARILYKDYAKINHPDLDPVRWQDDFQVLALGSFKLEGLTTAEKLEWLDNEWATAVDAYGSIEAAKEGIKEYLDCKVEASGQKPAPDDPQVRYLLIQNTNLSLRFWPGSLADAEYCMDFVETVSKKPMNVPEGYELWGIPDPAMPWLAPTTTKLDSIERIHGIEPDKIKDGAEKFILRDGMCCQLRRGEQKLMRFRVPLREGAILVPEDDDPLYEPAFL